MLGKLLKYEIKATARIFLPFYPVILVLALLNKLFFQVLENNPFMDITRGLGMMVYIFTIIAVFVITFIVMLQRFYKSLLGEEGYLSMTLPVKPATHIFTKLITSIMWYIASGIITIASIFIMLPSYDWIGKINSQYPRFAQEFAAEAGFSPMAFILPFILCIFIGLIIMTLKLYVSMAIGHLANKNRILCSFAAYIGVSMIEQAVTMLITTVVSMFFFKDFFDTMNTTMAIQEGMAMMNIFMYGIIILSLIFTVVYFIVTKVILSKKLNLE